jgi:hypothetical protein
MTWIALYLYAAGAIACLSLASQNDWLENFLVVSAWRYVGLLMVLAIWPLLVPIAAVRGSRRQSSKERGDG